MAGMAGMALKGWNWLEGARNCLCDWNWIDVTRMSGNAWKWIENVEWLEMAENGWKWLEMDGKGLKLTEPGWK